MPISVTSTDFSETCFENVARETGAASVASKKPYDATEGVLSAPKGRAVTAYFDLDKTILAGWSILPLLRDIALTKLTTPSFGPWLADTLRIIRRPADTRAPRSARFLPVAVSLLALALRKQSEQWLVELAGRIYHNELASLVYPEIRNLIRLHMVRGHTVVIASAATSYQVQPVAKDLGISNVFCSELEVRGGRFTGKLVGTPCCGIEKHARVADFANENGLRLDASFFYSDGSEDVPLLEAVGRPVATNPSVELRNHARAHGWPELDFPARKRQTFGSLNINLRNVLDTWVKARMSSGYVSTTTDQLTLG